MEFTYLGAFGQPLKLVDMSIGRSITCCLSHDPIYIWWPAFFNRNRNYLWNFVRMHGANRFFQLRILPLGCLEDQKNLPTFLDLSLPTVNRRYPREHTHTCCPILLNHNSGYFGGFLLTGSRCQHNDDVLPFFSHQLADDTRNSFFPATLLTIFRMIKGASPMPEL